MLLMILLASIRHGHRNCALLCFRRVGSIIIWSEKDRKLSQ